MQSLAKLLGRKQGGARSVKDESSAKSVGNENAFFGAKLAPRGGYLEETRS